MRDRELDRIEREVNDKFDTQDLRADANRSLDFFRRKLWPIYKGYGFTFAEAFMSSQLHDIQMGIEELLEDDNDGTHKFR